MDMSGAGHHALGNSGSFSHHDDESPFFADITLDLAEAHDIAETPEPTRKQPLNTDLLREMPRMPSIPDNLPYGGNDGVVDPGFPLAVIGTTPSAAMSPQETSIDTEDSVIDMNGKQLASISSSSNNNNNNRPILSETTSAGRVAVAYDQRRSSSRLVLPSTRRWPRDVQWAVAFCIVVPLCLLLPMLLAPPVQAKNEGGIANNMGIWIATAPAPRLATLHTLLWGYGASLLLSRLLYRTMGGGDGDDARHLASQVLLVSAPISVSVYVLLVVVMYFLLPLVYLLIPTWYLARDLFLFRSWKMTATTPGGRQAFFQALTCMTLDILSRSLRRSSFYRIVSLLLVVQLIVIGWWRFALLAALRSQSWLWIAMAILGGKWATGTVARLLTLIAAGGIQSWFAEQELLVQEMEGKIPRDDNELDVEELEGEGMIEFSPLGDTNGGNYSNVQQDEDPDEIPEAYRTVDASIYKSNLVPDEGMDDDFEDEMNVEPEDLGVHPRSRLRFFSARTTPEDVSSVKHFLLMGLTQSFGSVARCGLLGGVAQFVWSQLRKIDTARATFRSMSIGRESSDESSLWNKILLHANVLARDFVRNNSDMAMCHVAAFAKPYQRAAQDVAILIDESGVERMIHEDISTHMSSCVGGAISGIIVVFTGAVLVHQWNKNHPEVHDSAVFLDMLLAFIFCYTLIFTVMEPLRASIKAVYVSFAQHPQALSQSFPLIYHRLSRMSQSNLQ